MFEVCAVCSFGGALESSGSFRRLLGASGFVAQLATAVGGEIADEAVSAGVEIFGSKVPELANEAVESHIDDEVLMKLLEEGKAKMKEEATGASAKVVKGLLGRGTKAFATL